MPHKIEHLILKDVNLLLDCLTEHEDTNSNNVFSVTFTDEVEVVYSYRTNERGRYHVNKEYTIGEEDEPTFVERTFKCELSLVIQGCETANILQLVRNKFRRHSVIPINTVAHSSAG